MVEVIFTLLYFCLSASRNFSIVICIIFAIKIFSKKRSLSLALCALNSVVSGLLLTYCGIFCVFLFLRTWFQHQPCCCITPGPRQELPYSPPAMFRGTLFWPSHSCTPPHRRSLWGFIYQSPFVFFGPYHGIPAHALCSLHRPPTCSPLV